jgi:hypothetical protein
MIMPGGHGHGLVVFASAANFLGGEAQIQQKSGEKGADNALSHPGRLNVTL